MTVDIAAATLADMAPAMSFFFGFATIVTAAGIAAPLTVIAAAIAIGLLGNTLSQFSRSRPSTGSFVTFIGSAFGGYSAVVTAVVLCTGYIIAVASVVTISGGLAETILKHYLSITIPWQAISAVLVARGAGADRDRRQALDQGRGRAVRVPGRCCCSWSRSRCSSSTPATSTRSRSILHTCTAASRACRLGFPLAVYLFVGWENSAALAEEHHDPRKGVTRAVFSSILVVGVLYVFLSYATVVGFNDNAAALTSRQVPFVTAAGTVASGLVFIAYIAGFTSICSCLISATNSQARIMFNTGREGLLPSVVARLTARRRTPWVAFSVYLALALGLSYVFGWNTHR